MQELIKKEKELEAVTKYLRIREHEENVEKRVSRNKRIYTKGGVVESVLGYVELDEFDEEFFTGCLMQIKKIEVGSDIYNRFKNDGKKFIDEREAYKKTKKIAQETN
ncbi:MAG: hypothetical protein H6Q69_976 [Firmicutes bacterium]|nr:hypothetical protein [Bacillota bacterium]